MALRFLPFRFTIKEIAPRYDQQDRLVTSPGDSYWIPPTIPEAIRPIPTEDIGFYQWRPGDVQHIADAAPVGVQPYSAVSMFWSSDRQCYMQVPFNCMIKSVKEIAETTGYGWQKLTFHNTTTPQGLPLSQLGYNFEADTIAAPGVGAWMPQLLPDVYRYTGQHSTHTCRLAGEISIFLALIAFTTPLGNVIDTIKDCFRPDSHSQKWVPHARTGSKSGPSLCVPS